MNKYAHYLAENLDSVNEYAHYLAKNLDSVNEYAHYLAENLNIPYNIPKKLLDRRNKINKIKENIKNGKTHTR
jgi:archaellum component FlaC